MTFATGPSTHVASLTVRVGAYAWRVKVGEPLRLGRHPSNDVVIRGERVSRFHARIHWDGELPYLEDLGSLNGTFLEGRRLEGSRILDQTAQLRIGSTLLVLELEQRAATPPAVLPDAGEELAFFGERQREQRGVLRSQPAVHRLLLDLEAEQRTGALRLSAGGHVASLTFCLGKIVGARHKGRTGLDAVAKIFQTGQASYRFSADFEASEVALCVSPRDYLRKGHWGTARRYRREVLRRLVG
jgi:pSer/pThr/pTyr-binding forkhead associated (FHA) protein